MKSIAINSQYINQFPIFEPDGISLKTGETSFIAYLAFNGASSAEIVSIVESDEPGIYNASFTPNIIGAWNLIVESNYNKQKYADYINCVFSIDGKVFQYNASDNGTTIDIGVWVETGDSPILNLDSMSVKIYINDGTEVIDLGTQNTGTSEGVFRFTTSSNILNSATSYYLGVTAVQGSNTWTSNLGLTSA